jgi:predicted aspartyl protease
METQIPIEILELQDDQNIHPLIEAHLNGLAIRLVIDTGASHSCLDKSLLKHLLKNKNKSTSEIVMGIGNKKMTNNIVTVDELKIGDLTINNYPLLH